MARDKKKVPKHKSKETKVPTKALVLKDDIDYYTLQPVFTFSNADTNNWTIYNWNSSELKELINTFKKMEQLTWYQVQQHKGLQMKSVKDIEYPNNLSQDVNLVEIRVCDKKRLFGFINKNIFNLIWFDRDHSVCPEGKNRKYG